MLGVLMGNMPSFASSFKSGKNDRYTTNTGTGFMLDGTAGTPCFTTSSQTQLHGLQSGGSRRGSHSPDTQDECRMPPTDFILAYCACFEQAAQVSVHALSKQHKYPLPERHSHTTNKQVKLTKGETANMGQRNQRRRLTDIERCFPPLPYTPL
jgi:hypothetical protein